jgi:carbonic anhydrase
MSAVGELLGRNEVFAQGTRGELSALPLLGTLIVTCPDPRVDPAHVLGVGLGEAAVVRAAGGRVTPLVLENLANLADLAAVYGITSFEGIELVLLQHTDCGLSHMDDPEHHESLARLFGVAVDDLASRAISDPRRGVAVDIEALAQSPVIPDSIAVSGLLYDVTSGRVELLERRNPLRPTQEPRP